MDINIKRIIIALLIAIILLVMILASVLIRYKHHGPGDYITPEDMILICEHGGADNV